MGNNLVIHFWEIRQAPPPPLLIQKFQQVWRQCYLVYSGVPGTLYVPVQLHSRVCSCLSVPPGNWSLETTCTVYSVQIIVNSFNLKYATYLDSIPKMLKKCELNCQYSLKNFFKVYLWFKPLRCSFSSDTFTNELNPQTIICR